MTTAARTLWVLFLVDALLVTSVMRITGADDGQTIVRPVQRFLAAFQQQDSWRPMEMAERHLRAGHERPVYDEMLNVRRVKFQYPLSSLLFTRNLSLSWLNAISWFSVVCAVLVVWMILRRTGAGTPLELRPGDPAAGLAIVGLGLSFYPLVEAYSLGQIQAWINALLALAVLAWIARRDELAGVAIGLACLLKPTYVLLALWAIVRRRTAFLVPMAGVVLLGVLGAFVAYGVANNLDYIQALRTMGSHGEAFYPNQSFNGLLNRLLENGDSLKFDRAAFAPFHPVVYAGTALSFVLLMYLALWLPRRLRAEGTVADFAIVLLTITMTSPIAWVHHYGVLLPILAATAPGILANRAFGRWTGAVLALCYIAVSQQIGAANLLAGTAFGLFQSYVLVAAVVLLLATYRSLRPAPSTVVQPTLQTRPALT